MDNYNKICIRQCNERHRIPEKSKEKNGQKMKHLAAMATYLISNISDLIKSSYYESSCLSSFNRGANYTISGGLCIFCPYLLALFLIFLFLLAWAATLMTASSQSNPCLTRIRIQDLLGSQSVALFSSNKKHQWKNSTLHKKQITWSTLTIVY